MWLTVVLDETGHVLVHGLDFESTVRELHLGLLSTTHRLVQLDLEGRHYLSDFISRGRILLGWQRGVATTVHDFVQLLVHEGRILHVPADVEARPLIPELVLSES